MHKVLANHLVKLAQEKSVVRYTDPPNMTIAVDMVNHCRYIASALELKRDMLVLV